MKDKIILAVATMLLMWMGILGVETLIKGLFSTGEIVGVTISTIIAFFLSRLFWKIYDKKTKP